ncbi:MAG: hypothetical protein KR126chlam1_00024 [Chlamydiae bacterium]|nr:hypothetical protein [Chlamydiota bacterium]
MAPKLSLSQGIKTKSVEVLIPRIANSSDRVVQEIFLQAAQKSYALGIVCLQKDINIEKRDTEGNSPLHLAVGFADADRNADELIQAFVAKKADLNSTNAKGQTPLHLAASEGKVDMIKALLQAGAKATLADKNEMTPIDVALETRNIQIVGAFGENLNLPGEDHNTLLTAAAVDNDEEKAKLLIEAGADLNIADGLKNTPLHIAATKGYTDLALYLINKGAALTPQNWYGDTPLHYAIRERRYDIGGELLTAMQAKKIDSNIENEYGETPTSIAKENGYFEGNKTVES